MACLVCNSWNGTAQSFWKKHDTVSDSNALHSGILYSQRTNALFVSTYNMGILRSTDNGKNWQNVLSLPKNQPVFTLFESKKGYLFGGSRGIVLCGDLTGEKWDEMHIDFTDIKSFAEDSNGNLFLCSIDSGGILKSEDNGRNWVPCNQGLPSNFVNNLVNDENGNLYCTVLNDKSDVHGGLYIWESDINEWTKREIKLKIENSVYTVKVINIRSLAVTADENMYLSMDGIITNYSITGILKNSLSGLVNQHVWKHVTWNDTVDSLVTLQFDRIFATKTGHVFGSRPSSHTVGIYSNMNYSQKWFDCSAGLDPAAFVNGYFAEAPDGTVFLTTDYSNKIYLTSESKPGKKTQRIRFDPLPRMRLYEYAELAAVSSSGLDVRFRSMNNEKARIEGNNIFAAGLWGAKVKAYVDGNDTLYYEEESQYLSINKARNTISIEPVSNPTEGDRPVYIYAQSVSGEAVQFSVTHGNAWFRGSELVYTGPGKIEFMATEPGNNTYEAADTVWMDLCINPGKPVISIDTINGALKLISSSTIGNNWFVNDIPLQQKEKEIIPLVAGEYTLKVNIDGCISELSQPFVLNVTTVEEPLMSNIFTIYPQPFQDKLFIESGENTNARTLVTFIDSQGITLFSQEYPNNNVIALNTGDLFPGLYVIKLESGNKTYIAKVIKVGN